MRDFSMAFFHDYTGLEYGLPKFHDFPGPVVTNSIWRPGRGPLGSLQCFPGPLAVLKI